MLIDTVNRSGIDAVGQVDLGVRRHRNRPIHELGVMSRQIVATLLDRLGIESRFVRGKRVTTKEAVQVVEMVLSGLVNKRIVQAINDAGGRAIGISGKDDDLMVCEADDPELGFVGRPIEMNVQIIRDLYGAGLRYTFYQDKESEIFFGTTYLLEHEVIGDRIVAGTWAYAAAMTQGDITVGGIAPRHLHLPLEKLKSAGAEIETYENGFRVRMEKRPTAVDYQTLPFPGFPTDLQPMAIGISSIAEGTTVITENVFESRFRFVDEMLRLGADAQVDGHHVVVRGKEHLSSTHVWSSDIRAGAGLVLSALCADETTTVHDVFHIDRGYPNFVENLQRLGATIERTQEEELF